MPRQFNYAPGLPGYGTRGVDGSAGLIGVSTYFSAYDGNTDSVTIKSKIIANKELFSTDVNIPGYPTRTYQTGDIFIDKNARVFQIDFAESNLYKDTGIFLNTSGFFTSGPVQTLSPGFERYSNSYETEKYLIDTVYSDTVGNYTTYPISIYNNGAEYFASVSFVDGGTFAANFTDFYPFQVWNIGGTTSEADSIALVRDKTENLWRFGNFDSGSLRDASLSLDFPDVYIGGLSGSGTIHGTFAGTITTPNLVLPGTLTVVGDASFNDVYIGGTLYGGSPVEFGDDIEFAATANRSISVASSTVGYNLTVRAGADTNSTEGGALYLGGGDGTSSNGGIFLDTDGILSNTLTTDYVLHLGTSTPTGNVRLVRGQLPVQSYSGSGVRGRVVTATSTTAYQEGNEELVWDDFSNINFGTLILGANDDTYPQTVALAAGTRGTAAGSDGKNFNMSAGEGLDALSAGGDGGNIFQRGGGGGDDSSYTTPDEFLWGGGASSVSMDGGYGITSSSGGNGGELRLSSGVGGDASTSSRNPGDAGDLIIKTERGGFVRSTFTGGNGGDIDITAGVGMWSTSGTDGIGGSITIQAGGWPSNGGGDITIKTEQNTANSDIILQPFNTSARLRMINLPTTGTSDDYLYYQNTGNQIWRGGTPSDIKYKTIISDVSSALTGVLSVGVYNFKWNQKSLEYFDDVNLDETQIGLIAQEVEQVFPILVKDKVDDEKEVSYKKVLYEKLPIILTQAIKEQHSYITELETKVSDLESEIEAIKTHLGI